MIFHYTLPKGFLGERWKLGTLKGLLGNPLGIGNHRKDSGHCLDTSPLLKKNPIFEASTHGIIPSTHGIIPSTHGIILVLGTGGLGIIYSPGRQGLFLVVLSGIYFQLGD